MKIKNTILIGLSIILPNILFGQSENISCNRTVAFSNYAKYLPPDFCMPSGYKVFDVFINENADINNDTINDRFIQYNKANWQCGDTIYFSIYLGQKGGSFKLAKTLSNLCPPMAKYPDISWLVNNCKDPYTSRWGYDNLSLICFGKGLILVPFSINLSKGFDFYFEYDANRNNWYLTKKQGWEIPDGGAKGTINDITHKGYELEKVDKGISIDDFRIEDYLEPE